MLPLLAIARLTVLDLIRRRVLVILVLFGAGLIFLSFPLRDLTIGQWRRLILDIGLGATELSLTLIAILIGATLVASDLDRRTMYPLLAKPISRTTLVFGRLLGLSFVLWILCALMAAGTALMLCLSKEQGFAPVLLQNEAVIVVVAMLLGAIAVCLSTFTSATLAGIATLAISLGGHLTSNLAFFGGRAPSPLVRAFMIGFSRILPNLETLNLKDFAAHSETVSVSDLGIRLGYGLCYGLVAASLGAVVFTRRDLK